MSDRRHSRAEDSIDALCAHALLLADRAGDTLLGIKLADCVAHLERRRSAPDSPATSH